MAVSVAAPVQRRDHQAEAAEWERAITLWRGALAAWDQMNLRLVDEPTGNPIQRLRVEFGGAGAAAAQCAARLAADDPAIIVRDEFLDRNCFELDPCNLHPGEAEIVAERLRRLAEPSSESDDRSLGDLRREAMARRLAWPD